MAKRLYIQLYNSITGEALTLPLNPETTEIPTSREINTYNILGYGEVSVAGNKQLTRITLNNILPDSNSTFALLGSLIKQLNFKSYTPVEAAEMLNRWIENKDVVRVIISGYLNKEFLIEKHTSSIRESVSDLGYSIDLVEYRNPTNTTVLEFKTKEQKLTDLIERKIEKYIPNKQVCQAGQTIYKIAKLNYGGRFKELAALNGIVDYNADLKGKIIEMLPL